MYDEIKKKRGGGVTKKCVRCFILNVHIRPILGQLQISANKTESRHLKLKILFFRIP